MRYPITGSRVRFVDFDAQLSGGPVRTGVVNGPPITSEGSAYIPVWSAREGRESTTVYVHEANLLANEETA